MALAGAPMSNAMSAASTYAVVASRSGGTKDAGVEIGGESRQSTCPARSASETARGML